MSDEAQVMDALSTNDAVESDWDNLEETAPSMEEGVSDEGSNSEDAEWDALGNEDTSDKAESESDEANSEADGEVAEEAPEESGEKPEKADGDEDKSDDSEEVEEEAEESKSINIEELPDDAKLMVKVDGELQEISLKEYKNGISGEKAIAKRFNEYNVKEKEFNRQMDEVNEYINELGSTMRDQSILGGVQKIGELVGMAPHQLKEALIKELSPELERRYGMSEEELALELQREENSYLRQQTESNNARLKQEQAQRELEANIANLRETHNISTQEWNEYEATLADHYAKEEITPELVVNYSNFKQAESRAENIINSFDSNYASDSEVMDALVEQVYDAPNLSDDDFREILETALGSSKKAEAEAKVEKAVETKAKSKPKKKEEDSMFNPVTNSIGDEIDDWDDLL